MTAPNICLSSTSYRILRELADETGEAVTEILDKALDAYRRKLFFEGLHNDFAALRADPQAWAEELAEREVSEGTLMDDLDPDERWTEDGRVAPGPAEEKTA